jgi:hypothetical protein
LVVFKWDVVSFFLPLGLGQEKRDGWVWVAILLVSKKP